ncbi:MAG: beta strand repeat-containing protein, partial [Isosphaeraceae bacterium]
MFSFPKHRSGLASLEPSTSATRSKRRPRRAALSKYLLESLEDRVVLSTITWLNPQGGDWDTASNWKGGVLPGPSDNAVIDIAGITVTHNATTTDAVGNLTSKAAIALSAGTLALGSASTITNTLTLAGGNLTGAGALSVNSLLWSTGTMSGPGTTTVVAGGTMTLRANGSRLLDSRTLINAGSATWTGSGNLGLADGAAFNNLAGATFNDRGDGAIASAGGAASSFSNAGSFLTTTPSSGALVSVPFINSGAISIQSGSMTFLASASTTGSTAISAGSAVTFSGDNVGFGPGAAFTGAGTTSITGGATVTVSGGNSVSNLTMDNGTLTGPGTLNVTGHLTWTSGTMSGSGVTNALGGLTVGDASSTVYNQQFLSGRTLNNYGAATLSSYYNGYSGLFFDSGATLNNEVGANFRITTDVNIFADGGSPAGGTINNHGTFAKTGGTGTSIVSDPYNGGVVVFNQSGTGSVEVQSGDLIFDGGGTLGGSGLLTADAGATLGFGGGDCIVTAASGIAGAGSVEFSGGTLTDYGTYNVATTTTVDGGTANLLAPVTSLSSSLIISSGTINLSGGNPITVDTLTESGGVLTGSDTLTATGQITWTFGTMSGTGVTNSQGDLELTGLGQFLSGRTLNNFGTATLSDSGYYDGVFMDGGATINNEPGASFDITTDSRIYAYNFYSEMPPAGTINNQGTFDKTGGTGSSVVSAGYDYGSVAFNQSGT